MAKPWWICFFVYWPLHAIVKCSLFFFFAIRCRGKNISGLGSNLTVALGSGQTISGMGQVRASILSPCRPLHWMSWLCEWYHEIWWLPNNFGVQHTSKTQRWRVLKWPAMSPDLNPEHLWRDLKSAVGKASFKSEWSGAVCKRRVVHKSSRCVRNSFMLTGSDWFVIFFHWGCYQILT